MHATSIIIGLLLATAVQAGFYKWVDSEGNVHYSDRPVEQAEQLRISDRPTDSKLATQDENDSEGGDLADNEFGYQSFSLVSPEANQTFRSDEGQVDVSLLLQPGLQEGHKIRLSLDGVDIVNSFASTQVQLRKVSRGSHSLRARIEDAEGSTLLTSQAVSFHVRRASQGPTSNP